MKKSNVPATNGATPEFLHAVKDNLDIMTGRRGNKIDLPDIRALAFSSPPTQAECQAFNAYVNEWAKSMVSLVTRFDA